MVLVELKRICFRVFINLVSVEFCDLEARLSLDISVISNMYSSVKVLCDMSVGVVRCKDVKQHCALL